MNSNPSNCIWPKSSGFFENKHNPLGVFSNVFEGIQSLLECVHNDQKKVAFVGSSCMYPDFDRALIEDDLGKGAVYQNNGLFSYSNLLAWQLCKALSSQGNRQYFIVIPSDIFGDPKDSHFLAQIMGKIHVAKTKYEPKLTLPGLGLSVRHPIFEDDFKNCINQILEKYNGIDPINIATPVSYAKKISSIAYDLKKVVGYKGDIEWDAGFSDGQKFKVLNNDKLIAAIEPKFTPWMESLEKAYDRYKNEIKNDI